MRFADYKSTALSAEYTFDRSVVYAEYMKQTGMKQDMLLGMNVPFDTWGWAMGGSHQFTDKFYAGMAYSEYFSEAENTTAAGTFTKDITVSLRYDLRDDLILKGETHFINGTAMAPGRFNPGSKTEPNWVLMALKLTYLF